MTSTVRLLLLVCLALAALKPTLALADLEQGLDDARRAKLNAAAQAHPGPLLIRLLAGDEAWTAAWSGASGDLDALYEIGSITKGLTGLLLAEMVGSGELRLDQSIRELLPGHLRLADPAVGRITLVELATHHSGLPRLPDNLRPSDPSDPYAEYDEAALYLFLRRHRLDADGRGKYLYSNLGVGLLGHLLGAIDGRGYAEALRTRVLEPLGMKDSAVLLSEEQGTRLAPLPAGGARWNFDALAGAGAVVSSMTDMEALARALMNPDSAPALADAIRLATREHASIDMNAAIGLGWHLARATADASGAASEMIWHNGGTGSFHSMLGLRRDTREAVIALSNTPPGDFRAAVESALLPEIAMAQDLPTLTLAPEALKPLAGRFIEPSQGLVLWVDLREGALAFQLAGQSAETADAVSADRFLHRATAAEFEFERAGDARAEAVVLRQQGARLRFERNDRVLDPHGERTEIFLETAALKDFAGRYALANGPQFDVGASNSLLLVKLGDQPAFPVFAYAPDRFFYLVVDAQLSFERDEQGKVVALTLHQNGMDQRAARQP